MIHRNVTAKTLGMVRAVIFSIWLFMIATDPFYLLAELPNALFAPQGILALLPLSFWNIFLTTQTLYIFKLTMIILLILTITGAKYYRFIAITTVLCLTLHQGLIRGYGYFQHKELVVLYVSYILAVFPAADGFTFWSRQKDNNYDEKYSAALLLCSVLLLFSYLSIGLNRLIYGGTEIFTSDTMKFFIARASFLPNSYLFDYGKIVLQYSQLMFLLNLGFPLVTFFEILSPLCFFSKRFRYIWIIVILSFHFLSLIFMKIFFWQNMILIFALLFNEELIIIYNFLVLTFNRIKSRFT